MELGSILVTVVFALIFIGGLAFCFMHAGRVGEWED